LSLSLDKYYGNVNNEIHKFPGCSTTGVGERTQENENAKFTCTGLMIVVYLHRFLW